MSDRLILGTAGHIDHGKTSLVRALTGVDCDRLPEEKARGITIELGFAPLDLPSGRRLGIVDVPGHERLVRTMVAGATGIDLVLFVVAADEGMMPQSREHLAICDLLGIERGVVALSKADAVDDELAELARLDVEEELAGTALAGVPIVAVSSTTGAGLDALVAALDAVAGAAPPRTLRDGPAWLPVDRAFTMRGFGTVVTGTLRGATLAEGDPVEVLPEGSRQILRTKVRGLHVHGEPVGAAAPGSRCGLNLQGVTVDAVPRGSVVATPERLDWRPRVGAELRLLPNAPPLASGSVVTVHVGTSERSARVVLLDRERLEPGASALVELRFATPLVAVEGDRFIARGFARLAEAGWTVGGGRIVDPAPARGRRTRATRAAELETLAGNDRGAALRARLERAGARGLLESDLLREVRSLEGLEAVRAGGGRLVDPRAFDELVRACVAAVAAHHEAAPSDPWVGLAAVLPRLAERVPEEIARAALEAAVERGALEASSHGVRAPGHAARAADPERAQHLLAKLEAAGLAPETLESLARELATSPRELQTACEHLARQGRLVRVASGLYFARAPIDALRERVVAYLREHGSIDPAAYKTLTGATRKHTVPLMEYFDAEKLTLRRGNARVLRGERGRS
jgi:selenocysteine-specific elongation factor